jgi:hypothetical protein
LLVSADLLPCSAFASAAGLYSYLWLP